MCRMKCAKQSQTVSKVSQNNHYMSNILIGHNLAVEYGLYIFSWFTQGKCGPIRLLFFLSLAFYSILLCLSFVCVCLGFIQGVSDVDYSLYPSCELQRDWLTTYLESYKHSTGVETTVTEQEVSELYVQVCKFSLVSNSIPKGSKHRYLSVCSTSAI